jgi:hypothetical protein
MLSTLQLSLWWYKMLCILAYIYIPSSIKPVTRISLSRIKYSWFVTPIQGVIKVWVLTLMEEIYLNDCCVCCVYNPLFLKKINTDWFPTVRGSYISGGDSWSEICKINYHFPWAECSKAGVMFVKTKMTKKVGNPSLVVCNKTYKQEKYVGLLHMQVQQKITSMFCKQQW